MSHNKEGLTSSEAKILLDKYSENVLPEFHGPSDLSILISQLKSPLVYVLVFAGVITLFLTHYTDSIVIFGAIITNTFLGFIQERKANNALSALKKLIQPKTKVIRNGKTIELNVRLIVPGDICILNTGDKIPGDGKIMFANRLFVSESMLTGESVPVSKEVGSDAFMGTVVTSGRGKILIELTGGSTKIGHIARDIQEPHDDTPIKKQLKDFSKVLTIIITILTIGIFFIGLILGKEPVEIFTISVALAVSAIPEGLLVGMTVVLAIGMQRILKRKGLVRNLESAETLGGVTTICVDKTGTLTEGRMEVVKVEGDKTEIAKQALIANDLDDPIVIALWEWANKNINWKDVGHENLDEFTNLNPRLDSMPFSAKERFFASLNTHDNKTTLYVNGAPEFLLQWSKISNKDKAGIIKRIEYFSMRGMRLVALAKKEMKEGKIMIDDSDVKHGLEWVGLIAFTDPIRTGVREVLKNTSKAGIRLIVITGDFSQTASYVMRELGFPVKPEDIILGSELEDMNTLEVVEKISSRGKETILFARTTPEQKLKIVESLKRDGEVVAMMGDGVNDALALKKADIGIVVGNATDVAKESSDLILLDSSFETILAAIEEGRGIFNNLRKIILYLMSDSFSEIILVVVVLIINQPLPITAIQILWINLVSDGVPHLALTVDPRDKKIMNHKPRNSNERLISKWMLQIIAVISVLTGIFVLTAFLVSLKITEDVVLAQSIAFATLGVTSLLYVFSVRTLTQSFLSQNPFENRWLNLAVFGGLLLQFLPFVSQKTMSIFGVKELEVVHWAAVFTIGILVFILIEISKRVLSLRQSE